MNFEDEPYVRVYKRKTVTTKLIGWEGRMVLRSLLLEVDRAGVLDLDGMDPAEALVALDEMPLEHAKVGMGRLIERGVVVIQNGVLFIPRFMEAQEARQSDAQRQRESRGKRAAAIRASKAGVPVAEGAATTPPVPEPGATTTETPPTAPVTNSDRLASQPVTNGHTRSHDVTRGHPSSAQLSSTKQERSLSGASGPPEALVLAPPAASAAHPKQIRRWTRVPDGWQPKPEHVSLGMQLGFVGALLETEVLKFRDHEFAKPKSDPDACFRNWLREAPNRRRAAIGGRGPVQNNHGKTGTENARRL